MIDFLILAGAVIVYLGIFAFAWYAASEYDSTGFAIFTALLNLTLGTAALWALFSEALTEHPSTTLDHRYWACTASHKETSTSYVVPARGGVAMPITSTTTECDRWERKP